MPDIRYHVIVGPGEALPVLDDDEQREALLSYQCEHDDDSLVTLVLDALSFNSWELAHLLHPERPA
jgi:hypothetical protein